MAGAPKENGPFKYDFKPNLENPNSSFFHQVQLTGSNRSVLEIGPATGYITRILQDRGCSVTCIEIDPDMAAEARRYSCRMIVGDIETLDLHQSLGSARFDVILLGDVLEHLKDPLRSLTMLKMFLNPEGYVVASLPNIAHGSVRLSLLYGNFQYQPLGLLDEGHLRFFTFGTALEMFHKAGYDVRQTVRIPLGFYDTELHLDSNKIPQYIAEEVAKDPESFTYQFVFKAYARRETPFPVSIILPVYNQVEKTIACLEALAKNTPYELYELIIVDNASTDGTAEFLNALGGDVQLVTNSANLGFARACNQGARLANGRYLVFMSNAANPQPGWLDSLLHIVENLKDIALIGGIKTTGMLVKKEAFLDVGGFDEERNQGEDSDLSFKIREKGYRIFRA